FTFTLMHCFGDHSPHPIFVPYPASILHSAVLFSNVSLVAAKAFFKQVVGTVGHKPAHETTDKHAAYPRAICRILGRTVVHRTSQYLNKRIEQDHRRVKQRYYPMHGFGSFASAARFFSVFDEVRHHFRISSLTTNQTRSYRGNRKPPSTMGRTIGCVADGLIAT
ncbi:MAG: DDE-type integrase/transposase/recombinase, partial [Aggregatilineales bacterium]